MVSPANDVELATAQHTALGSVVRQQNRRAREVRTACLRHFLLNRNTSQLLNSIQFTDVETFLRFLKQKLI